MTILINLLFNLRWSIPAWVLLILHYAVGISIVYFWIALGAWIFGIFLLGAFVGWARNQKQIPDNAQKENKNPYSNKSC